MGGQLREQNLGFPPRFLFVQPIGDRRGNKPYASGSYNAILAERETDDRGRDRGISGWSRNTCHDQVW
jgi:hypothetical protein